jgi:hypothetical protein
VEVVRFQWKTRGIIDEERLKCHTICCRKQLAKQFGLSRVTLRALRETLKSLSALEVHNDECFCKDLNGYFVEIMKQCEDLNNVLDTSSRPAL